MWTVCSKIQGVTIAAPGGIRGRDGQEGADEVISKAKETFMEAKKLSDADKAQTVLDWLQGKETMAEICNRYGISPIYL
jgi:hypothetical protein